LPAVPAAGGSSARNAGATAVETAIASDPVAAQGLTPFDAATTNVDLPDAVGLPEIASVEVPAVDGLPATTPVPGAAVNPTGKDPAARVILGAGSPDATKVYM
jgi:hypothetical protein